MNSVIDPRISNNFTIKALNSTELLFSDGVRGVELTLENGIDLDALTRFQSDLYKPASLQNFFKAHNENVEEIVETLLPFGCISESTEIIDKYGYNAEYLAHRLTYYFRVKSSSAWSKNLTLNTLYGEQSNTSLALGFLLETFHHVKGAKWTSVPVLAHRMHPRQRDILEKFYLEERNHYKYIAKAFEKQGIDPERILNSIPNTETELLEKNFYACANMSVLDFSAAIIVPEVDEFHEVSDNSKNLFENLVGHHDINPEFIKSFKLHGDDHATGEHNSMPHDLISLEGVIRKERASELLQTVDHTINAYTLFLDGVYKKYSQNFEIRSDLGFSL